jgi:hypothetical protein
MTVTSLPHSTNGVKPTNGTRAPRRVAPLLGPTIDHLLELRDLIRRAQAEERTMTAEIVRAMESAGVTRLEGCDAVAILDRRTTLQPDPGGDLLAALARPQHRLRLHRPAVVWAGSVLRHRRLRLRHPGNASGLAVLGNRSPPPGWSARSSPPCSPYRRCG